MEMLAKVRDSFPAGVNHETVIVPESLKEKNVCQPTNGGNGRAGETNVVSPVTEEMKPEKNNIETENQTQVVGKGESASKSIVDMEVVHHMKEGERVNVCPFHEVEGCDGEKDPDKLVCQSCFKAGRLQQVQELLGFVKQQPYQQKYEQKPKAVSNGQGFFRNLVNAGLGYLASNPKTSKEELAGVLADFCEEDKTAAERAAAKAMEILQRKLEDEKKAQDKKESKWRETLTTVQLWYDQFGQEAFEAGTEIEDIVQNIKERFQPSTGDNMLKATIMEVAREYNDLFKGMLWERCEKLVKEKLVIPK